MSNPDPLHETKRIRTPLASWLILTLVAFGSGRAEGQGAGAFPRPEELVRIEATPVSLVAGSEATTRIKVHVREGWHVNANPPSLDYLIPTSLSLDPPRGVRVVRTEYPKSKLVKFGFEQEPLAVYDGSFELGVTLSAGREAASGRGEIHGRLRFQSCNDQVCLAPTEVSVTIPLEIVPATAARGAGKPRLTPQPAGPPQKEGGTQDDSGTTLGGASERRSGFESAPPSGGASRAARDPIGRLFERGSWAAFLGLFFMGLALNLTPCVYPMLGVTVSIFGARRAAPPAQVVASALLYVLGIATMYTALGLIAAWTGGLFGGFLQSPLVLAGIGLLLVTMSLSMFGLYELQVPPALLERVGGTGGASMTGVFFSGLVVGIFAAPCIGPPIVALLALVAQRADPWFGFWSFFVLSLGLGAPYLALASSSGSLQRLPRSGQWMVWVKKLFGVILLAVGGFYLLLALQPRVAAWVVPFALVAGGLYLGFVEKSGRDRPAFRRMKWALGAVAVMSGLLFVALAPREGLSFALFTPAELEAARAEGRPVLLDFSADWCAPCHELERFTFSDRRVKEATRGFRAFKVDLTHFDSPEVESWRKRFAIAGVPTLIFLDPAGREVTEARIEGFVPPEELLRSFERVR